MRKITAKTTILSLCAILLFTVTTYSAGNDASAETLETEFVPMSMPVATYIPTENISAVIVEESTEEILSEIPHCYQRNLLWCKDAVGAAGQRIYGFRL